MINFVIFLIFSYHELVNTPDYIIPLELYEKSVCIILILILHPLFFRFSRFSTILKRGIGSKVSWITNGGLVLLNQEN